MNKTGWLVCLGVTLVACAALYVGFDAMRSNDSTEHTAGTSAGKDPTARRPGGGGASGGRPPALVTTKPVEIASINDRLSAIGSGEARASVAVVPLSAGTIADVTVVSGATVAKGDVLVRLDDAAETIARDRAERATRDARRRLDRLEKLYTSQTSTQVEVDDARAVFEDAELAQRDAELQLKRRTLMAPIAGTVGIVAVEPGRYVTTQTEIVTIDDRSSIDVEFWVPERFAASLSVGQPVEATAFADPGRRLDGKVRVIGSRVESVSRTLPVKARFDNGDDRLRPGMSFQLGLNFPGEPFAAVDPLAVQWDSDGSFVWQVINGMAVREPVRIVQRNADSVLVDAALSEGDEVVTEGVLSIREGASVRVAGARRGAAERTAEEPPRPAGAGSGT